MLTQFNPLNSTQRLLRFKKGRAIPPLFTGGPVAITSDGQRLITCIGEELLLTNVSTGAQICSFSGVSILLPTSVRILT